MAPITPDAVGEVIRFPRESEMTRQPALHGITIDHARVYVATIHGIYCTMLKADGTFAELEHIVKDLPRRGSMPIAHSPSVLTRCCTPLSAAHATSARKTVRR